MDHGSQRNHWMDRLWGRLVLKLESPMAVPARFAMYVYVRWPCFVVLAG
jgi:hypothetical protein